MGRDSKPGPPKQEVTILWLWISQMNYCGNVMGQMNERKLYLI